MNLTETFSYFDGLKSGAKGTANGLAKAGAGAVSLGQWRPEGPFELTELDLAYGAGYSEAIAEVSGEILIGVGTGSLGCAGGKVGKLLKGYDYASNVVQTGAGIVNGDPLQAAAGIAGSIPNRAAKCFTAGTQVVVGFGLTENGELLYDTKNIEDIQLGDLVYSYDTATGEYGYNEVTATFERNTKSLVHLTIVDQHGNEQTIETTESHPFWVVTDEPDLTRAARSVVDEDGFIFYHDDIGPGLNGFWVEAKDLREGDTFLGADGELSTLKSSLRVEQDGGVSVFNFEVAGNHNYFVLAKDFELGQSCILVHNATGYRAMSQAEFDDIMATGKFRQGNPGTTYPGKWFAASEEGALAFKDKMKNWSNPPSKIIKANVPDDAIEIFSRNHDGISDSFYVGPEKLSVISILF